MPKLTVHASDLKKSQVSDVCHIHEHLLSHRYGKRTTVSCQKQSVTEKHHDGEGVLGIDSEHCIQKDDREWRTTTTGSIYMCLETKSLKKT